MAYLGMNFDATQVAPSTERSALPQGTYSVIIEETSIAQSKAGDNYLKVVFQVVDGEHRGRKIFTNINLWHSSQKARDFAQRDLSAICHATGTLQMQDSSQLHNKPMKVKVKYVEPKGQYGESNEVTAYLPMSAPSTPPSTPPSAPAQITAPPAFAAHPAFAPAPAPFAPPPQPAFAAPQPAPQPAFVAPPAASTPPWRQ